MDDKRAVTAPGARNRMVASKMAEEMAELTAGTQTKNIRGNPEMRAHIVVQEQFSPMVES